MMCVNWKHWRLEMASSRTSTDRRHHKHSKHKHRHKHGHHHHRHHGKHKKKGRDREKGKEKRKDEVPELNVDERELQTALEKLEEAMLEQCGHSDSSADDDSDAPPPSPSPSTPKPHPQEPVHEQSPKPELSPELELSSSPRKVESDNVDAQRITSLEGVANHFGHARKDRSKEDDNVTSEKEKAAETEGDIEKKEDGGAQGNSSGSDSDGDDDSVSLESGSSDFGGFPLCKDFKRGEKRSSIQIKIRALDSDDKLSQQTHKGTNLKTVVSDASTIICVNSKEAVSQVAGGGETDEVHEVEGEKGGSGEGWRKRGGEREEKIEEEERGREKEGERRGREREGDTEEGGRGREKEGKRRGREKEEEKESGREKEGKRRGREREEEIEEEEIGREKEGKRRGREMRGKRKQSSLIDHKKRRKQSKHDRHSRRSLSRSPSTSRSRSHSRSHSRSLFRSRRSSSHSRRRRYSRSPSRSKRHARSHSSSQSRSPYHSRSRRHHSRSPYHSGRRDYRTRVRSRSPYRSKRSPIHSTSSYHRRQYGRFSRAHRSRSKSRSKSKSKSRSRSRSRSPYRRRRRRSYSSRSRSKSKSPEPRERREVGGDGGGKEEVREEEMKTVVKEVAAKVKQVHIDQFTALCKDIQKKQEKGEEEEEEEEGGDASGFESKPAVRAPFQLSETPAYQSGLILHNNVWKTPNQIVAENNVLQTDRPLVVQFPVSSGIEHQQKENTYGAPRKDAVFAESKPVSMGELVVKRLEASQRLQVNPQDAEAQQILAYVEQQAAAWTGSQIKPGQFTGQKQLKSLTREDHKTGIQAWVKKDMFKGLAPVLSGFGMKMMKKMGWNVGQPLGRMGKGVTEPITMDVKVDRAGLSSVLDKAQQIVPASAIKASSATSRAAHLVQGKHPVSALQEICAKKRWDPPHYDLVSSSGPSHLMSFCYKVTLPCGSFQPAVASPTKKQAKVQAALACLQGLGFVENVL